MDDKIDFNSKTQDEENRILSIIDEKYSIQQIDNIIYDIRREFYEEKPVDINTFIYDTHFLGNSLKDVFFPLWTKLLKKVHPSPFVNNFYEIILEAPLGAGKSYVSAVSLLYEIYKLLCMRSPQDFYNLGAGTRIYFIIFSVTLDSADINWNYIKTFMKKSPWFQGLATKITQAKKLSSNEQDIFKDIFIGIGSNTDHSISRAIFGGQLDEGNFQSKASNQAYENYEALITRIESRFMSGQGTPPGILWLTSSPTLESSFTTDRIQASKKLESTLVVENIPIWEVLKGTDRHRKTYVSGKSFYVFCGDATKDPFIINSGNKNLILDKKQVIKVPYEHYNVFKRNTPKALRDNAGRRISITSNLFSSKDDIKKLMTAPNRFKTPIDERFIKLSENTIGNTGSGIIKIGMKSNTNLIDFIIDREYFKQPMFHYAYRFIHIDIGAKIDRCGIASSFAIYTDQRFYQTTQEVIDRSHKFFYNEWAIALEAFEGDEIPFGRIIDLLVFLKNLGYPIKLITTDQREGGRKLRQDLTEAGFETGYLSMDKDRIEYDDFQDLCLEERTILADVPLTFLELSELQDNGTSNKKPTIDHPKYFSTSIDGLVIKGTKDISDAVGGSIINASKAKSIFNPILLYNKHQQANNSKNNMEKMYNQSMINKFGNKLFKK